MTCRKWDASLILTTKVVGEVAETIRLGKQTLHKFERTKLLPLPHSRPTSTYRSNTCSTYSYSCTHVIHSRPSFTFRYSLLLLFSAVRRSSNILDDQLPGIHWAPVLTYLRKHFPQETRQVVSLFELGVRLNLQLGRLVTLSHVGN